MVTVWCSAAPLIRCSFVNPRETITPEKNAQQMDEMHGKLQHWHRSRERAQFSRQRPTTCTTTQSWTNWATKFCLICHTHLTLANQLPLLEASWQLFAGKMLPQPEGAGNAFQEFVKSQSMDFYARRISKLISHWERCVDCNGPYFD